MSTSGLSFRYIPVTSWIVIIAVSCALGYLFWDGLALMVRTWENKEEYGYGFLIPVIALFFIWQKKNDLAEIDFVPSWSGVVILIFGLILFFLGELSALYIIIQYAFLLSLYGLVLAYMGWRAAKLIWAPLLLLVFMIPLPNFLYQGLSSQLQLISSEIGVWAIRLFGISVFLEGNVIDLGAYKLQVVEACSGLRYLFPLMTLGFMVAYIYQGAVWKKVVLFLSTIPITVLMNSFRIGAIGVMVEYWGPSMAEGFLHDFEGWIIFMACLGVLLLEMGLLSRVGGDKKSLQDVFGLDLPEPRPDDANRIQRPPSLTLYISLVLCLVTVPLALSLKDRSEIVPDREVFAAFPMVVEDWKGRTDQLEQIYLDALRLDDYLVADFESAGGDSVNLYIAYYSSQSKGESIHSPKSCLPGGGWRVAQSDEIPFEASGSDSTEKINRVVIRKGDYTQLVYYWFQGRGRVLANEYMVKWLLFWDGLTKNRTDGALVRLTTFLRPGEDIRTADVRLRVFAEEVSDDLTRFVPD